MRSIRIAGIAAAAIMTVTPFAFAQTKATPQKEMKETKASGAAATQTFTGCVMSEPDYRRAHNLGSGALGGLGLGDEFVLVDATISPAKSTTSTESSTASSMPANTSKTPKASKSTNSSTSSACVDQGTAYRLTGQAEEKIKGLVGHQLEIQGRFKHADDVAADGTRPGEKLPAEVEIVSFREASTAADVSQPATAPASTASTPEPAPAQSTTPPATSTPSELPHTASSTALLGLIGVLALMSGLALGLIRRRVF